MESLERIAKFIPTSLNLAGHVMATWACQYGKLHWAAYQDSSVWMPCTSRQRVSLHYIMRMFCFFLQTGWKKNARVAGGWPAHSRTGCTSSLRTAMVSNAAYSSAAEAVELIPMDP